MKILTTNGEEKEIVKVKVAEIPKSILTTINTRVKDMSIEEIETLKSNIVWKMRSLTDLDNTEDYGTCLVQLYQATYERVGLSKENAEKLKKARLDSARQFKPSIEIEGNTSLGDALLKEIKFGKMFGLVGNLEIVLQNDISYYVSYCEYLALNQYIMMKTISQSTIIGFVCNSGEVRRLK